MRTLATEEIGKAYGGRQVVRGVSLEIRQGEVVGLLGPNGAGKTTSFYMIVGLVRPDYGADIDRRQRHYTNADVPARARVRDQLSAAGAFDVSQADGGGKHSGGAGDAARITWEARRKRSENAD